MVKRQNAYSWERSYPTDILWECFITPKPVSELLATTASEFPDHPALDFLGRIYSYQDIEQAVERVATGLQQLKVCKGTKVGLVLPNCPQFVIAYYAICRIGGIVVNCNPLYTVPELTRQLEDAEVEVIITVNLALTYDKVVALQEKLSIRAVIVSDFASGLLCWKKILFKIVKYRDICSVAYRAPIYSFETLLKTPADVKPVDIDPAVDVAVLQYTGGTTGTPKGAMLTHANIYSNTVQTGMWFSGLKKGKEVIVGVLPFFHVFAMTVIMNLSVHKACTILLYPKFNLKQLIRDIVKKKPTIIPGVPSVFSAIAHMPDVQRHDMSSIKMCISGGAPLPLDIKQSFEKLTRCSLVEGYGLTEASPVVAANPLFGKQKPGSIGLPFPQTVVEIRGLKPPYATLPTGEIGEICIQGPQVMKGYYQREEQTRQVLAGGCLHTGDMGYIDEEGYIFVADRLKDMIIVNGFNVYPREVEEVLYQHPAIQEAAVVGIASEEQGQSVKAYVACKEGCSVTESQLYDFLKARLVKYKLPSVIEFRKQLPKTMIGKISKKDL